MNPEVMDALLALGEYTGTEDAFLLESTTTIRGVLNCSLEEAVRVLQNLRDSRKLDFCITLGGELPREDAHWYWYVPI